MEGRSTSFSLKIPSTRTALAAFSFQAKILLFSCHPEHMCSSSAWEERDCQWKESLKPQFHLGIYKRAMQIPKHKRVVITVE